MRSDAGRAGTARIAAGDTLLHPVPLAAVALLLLNDHVLKAAWPGAVTGKLSDFAGLAFFPLLLVGIWEIGLLVARRYRGPGRGSVVVAVVLSGVAFAFVKTTPAGATAFGALLAFGQWLPSAAAGFVRGAVPPLGAPAVVAVDPTDLVALPALLVPLAVGLRRTRTGRPS